MDIRTLKVPVERVLESITVEDLSWEYSQALATQAGHPLGSDYHTAVYEQLTELYDEIAPYRYHIALNSIGVIRAILSSGQARIPVSSGETADAEFIKSVVDLSCAVYAVMFHYMATGGDFLYDEEDADGLPRAVDFQFQIVKAVALDPNEGADAV